MAADIDMKPHLFLFAGEVSGDIHGGRLLSALKERLPGCTTEGVAGPEMRRQGINTLIQMEEFQVMGFVDVAQALPRLIRHFRTIYQHILSTKPDAVILIDYPGFNLRLAKALRKKGYQGKIIYYISPSVWAWRKNRIFTLEKHVDLLLTIYPFEEKCYSETNLPVTFVGNPLKEYISEHSYEENWKKILKIPVAPAVIALFPGSRPSEIYRNFPLQLRAAELLAQEKAERVFAVSCSTVRQKEILLHLMKTSSLKHGQNLFIVPKEFNYELMQDAHAAIAKSGTVTLELALHACPTVVTYNMSWMNQAIAKYVLRINLPHFCIVNILGNQTIFPELIGHGLSPYSVYTQLYQLDSDIAARERSINACKQVAQVLQDACTSKRAADAIFNELCHA